MARRTIYVGGIEELERVKPEYAGRLVPDRHYVFGPGCDATEEADLLWEDLRECFYQAGLTPRQRFALAKAIELMPFCEIGRRMGVDESVVREHVRAAYRKLDSLPPGTCGCWTVLIEECGGWSQVRHHLTRIVPKKRHTPEN